ncbi:hypothetical protein DAT35_08575 [Vitiosangium sp. GDMCC 1.1324]|nr:hypothetical protein DAT35_08575 [Vitiosangium sp. GDMCC 1.1324]
MDGCAPVPPQADREPLEHGGQWPPGLFGLELPDEQQPAGPERLGAAQQPLLLLGDGGVVEDIEQGHRVGSAERAFAGIPRLDTYRGEALQELVGHADLALVPLHRADAAARGAHGEQQGQEAHSGPEVQQLGVLRELREDELVDRIQPHLPERVLAPGAGESLQAALELRPLLGGEEVAQRAARPLPLEEVRRHPPQARREDASHEEPADE